MTKTLHIVGVAVLAAVLFLAPAARGTAGPSRAPIRIMTYNTALMNVAGTFYGVPPGVTLSFDTNKDNFGGAPYAARITMMADRIKQEDPDVVILNEVWNDDSKNHFINELANPNDPSAKWQHFVSKIQGDVPGMYNPYADPGLTQQSSIQLFSMLGWNDAALAATLFLCPPLPPGICPIVDIDIHMQDSGIMLFSKHPFVAFDSGLKFPKRPKGVTVEGWNGPNTPWGWDPKAKEVAVTVYERARGMDELASKAAGMVRIQIAPGSIADVVFSHTNADEVFLEENADVRATQLSQVRQMVTRALTADELATEQVYMLGDLNTPGHNKETGNLEEWSTFYGKNAVNDTWSLNPGVFFACGNDAQCTAAIPGSKKVNVEGTFFTDTWGFETSPKDVSKTNYLDKSYFDYVLHSKPPRHCMQHIRIGSEMKDYWDGEQLSDHLPVHADFNLEAPHCTPNRDDPNGPQEVDLTSDHHVETYDARITHPGSMQWYYLPEAGTYWINIIDNQDHVAFDVYNDNDLSNPLPPYHGETQPRKGKKFVTYNPIYVRTYAVDATLKPDRNWVGPYSIQLWRATGATPDDSISIPAAVPTKYNWVSMGSNQPTVWFDFYTNQTISGAFAHTTIISEAAQAGTPAEKWHFDNQLWVQTGADPLQMASYTPLNQELAQANPVPPGYADFVNPDPQKNPNQSVTGWQVEMPDLAGTPNNSGTTDPKKYFYVLSQPDDGTFAPPGQPPQFLYTWLTLLTDIQYLRPSALQAKDMVFHDPEVVWFGHSFDKGPVYPNYVPFLMTKGDLLDIPNTLPIMVGPFKSTDHPVVLAFDPKDPLAPPHDVGEDHNGGSDIFDISIARGEVGYPDCQPYDPASLNTKCYDMPMSSHNNGWDYSYHLYYGVAHDIPYQP
jgi:hypothetical protein